MGNQEGVFDVRRIYIWSNGCEQRNLEKTYFQHLAKKNADEVTTIRIEADVALLVTCCVSNAATQNSMEEIEKCIKDRVNIIVYGCLPGIKKEWLVDHGIHSFSVYQRSELLQVMKWKNDVSFPHLTEEDELCDSLDGKTPREKFDTVKNAKKILIDNGCLNRCSYCVIRFATGKLKSRDITDIVKEWNYIVQPNEYIMLMGGDTGAYGMDIGTNLPMLLKTLHEQPKHAKIYLHDLNIRWMKKYLNEFCELLQNDSRIVRGMTMPIQSGSDKILSSMNRHYNAEDIQVCFNKIHDTDRTIILGTHVIVGYPGENKTDFEETVDLLQKLPLDFISCFAYSEHVEAISAKFFPKVDTNTVLKRFEILSKLFGNKLKIYQ